MSLKASDPKRVDKSKGVAVAYKSWTGTCAVVGAAGAGARPATAAANAAIASVRDCAWTGSAMIVDVEGRVVVRC